MYHIIATYSSQTTPHNWCISSSAFWVARVVCTSQRADPIRSGPASYCSDSFIYPFVAGAFVVSACLSAVWGDCLQNNGHALGALHVRLENSIHKLTMALKWTQQQSFLAVPVCFWATTNSDSYVRINGIITWILLFKIASGRQQTFSCSFLAGKIDAVRKRHTTHTHIAPTIRLSTRTKSTTHRAKFKWTAIACTLDARAVLVCIFKCLNWISR